MYSLKRIVLESYPVLLVAMGVSLAAGVILNASIPLLTRLPILAVIPVINGTGGNLGSILGARLSSALHLGTIRPRLRGQRGLAENLGVALAQGFTIFTMIATTFLLTQHALGSPFHQTVLLSLALFLSGALLTVIVILITVGIAFASYRGGLDPDNVVIPVMTSAIDVVGIICLMLSIKIVGV